MDAKLPRERKENSIEKLCFIDSLCFLHQHARRYHFKYFLINVPEYMQLALTHYFIDWLKYFKYFLLIRTNISNISWSTCQKMQLALTHFFIDRFKYPATAQKWWLSYSRPLQLVANWTSPKTKLLSLQIGDKFYHKFFPYNIIT